MTLADESWREHAACIGQTAVFFPPDDRAAALKWDPRPAQAICDACPSFDACRAWVRANPQRHGVWAGMSPAQRENDRRWLRRLANTERPRRLTHAAY